MRIEENVVGMKHAVKIGIENHGLTSCLTALRKRDRSTKAFCRARAWRGPNPSWMTVTEALGA